MKVIAQPIYDIHKSYRENLESGPFFEGQIPTRVMPPKKEWIDFLGHEVAVPLGVPAGPLLNANWVIFAAQMGFDIVTYKTIRSKPHPAYPLPNMIYVDTQGDLTHDRHHEVLKASKSEPDSMAELAVTNSFGIPSLDRDSLIEDIARANAAMQPGQVMIVSIVGTPRPNEDFVQDFALASQIALDGGAKIIEVDLSCPNVSSKEGSLFTNPDAICAIAKTVKETIGTIPLIIKVGVIEEKEVLRQVILRAARGGVEAICGINTVSMKITKEDGSPALGENRLKAGVCGSPIHTVALDFTVKARTVIEEERLDMRLMATGGVCQPEHFNNFFAAGADVAMSAAGMMWDPYLATNYHRGKK